MRHVGGLCFVIVCAAALSGCVEAFPTVPDADASLGPAIARPARSPRPATVALASLDGPPATLESRFSATFAQAVARRDIAVTSPSAARYLVRGYIDASRAESGAGTNVAFVYDIFDAQDERRIDRVTDTLSLPATDADAWALVDDRVMNSLASRSADRLATALADTPEARAAQATTASVAPAGSTGSAVN